MLRFLFASLITVGLGTTFTDAAVVTFDNGGGDTITTGDSLDEISMPTNGIAVVEVPGLTIDVVSFTGDNLNATGSSFGINSTVPGDDGDAFDVGEDVTFRFNQAVDIEELDFTLFEGGDVFNFAGTSIAFADTSMTSADRFTFPTPLRIAANTPFTLQATTGVVGLQQIELSVVAVPEPTSMALLVGGLGIAGWRRRRR